RPVEQGKARLSARRGSRLRVCNSLTVLTVFRLRGAAAAGSPGEGTGIDLPGADLQEGRPGSTRAPPRGTGCGPPALRWRRRPAADRRCSPALGLAGRGYGEPACGRARREEL